MGDGNEEAEVSDREDHYEVEDVARYLIDVMAAYLVDVTVEVEEDDDQITFNIETDKPGLVIGKHGKIVNSLGNPGPDPRPPLRQGTGKRGGERRGTTGNAGNRPWLR